MSDVTKVIDSLLSEADEHDARSIKIREAVDALRLVSLVKAVDPSPTVGARLISAAKTARAGIKKGKRKYTKRSKFWSKKK